MPQRLVQKPTPPHLFVDHGEVREMRWDAMAGQGYLVPNDRFYVRNTSATPRIDAATWRLDVGGAAARPYWIDLAELRAVPQATFVRAIECAGNGRSFFETVQGRETEGTPWKLGGIGVAEWRGVPLRTLLERARPNPGARWVLAVGGDEKRVSRPFPIEKAMAEDTLVALEMNGEPLPPDHGFPARLVVPGWVGIAHIKWLMRLELRAERPLTYWNTEQYAIDGEPLGEQVVKSALELPWPATLRPGRQTIAGRAWSASGAIAKVEHTVDGERYREARLIGENVPRAWTRFEFEWDATPGEHAIRVRATDERGTTQPDEVPFNRLGYLYGGVVPHPVRVR